jgi:hypothetical protein
MEFSPVARAGGDDRDRLVEDATILRLTGKPAPPASRRHGAPLDGE